MMPASTRESAPPTTTVRPLREADLDAAHHMMRVAFGTFLGLPEPADFMPTANYVHTRFRANPDAAHGAEALGELVGSNFVSNWGSVGFFGPLTTRPDMWDRGVGKRLIEPAMEQFERWGTKHVGLFTFAQSAKHISLYRKFGFWPRFLTALMARPVGRVAAPAPGSLLSQATAGDRDRIIAECRGLTARVHDGLDLTIEIESVAAQHLGDTVLVWKGSNLAGLAICHVGPGTEAGAETCYIKFGAVDGGPDAPATFEQLLAACEALASARGMARLLGGANAAREEAWNAMQANGFRIDFQGVALHRHNDPAYNRPGVWIMDDWR